MWRGRGWYLSTVSYRVRESLFWKILWSKNFILSFCPFRSSSNTSPTTSTYFSLWNQTKPSSSFPPSPPHRPFSGLQLESYLQNFKPRNPHSPYLPMSRIRNPCTWNFSSISVRGTVNESSFRWWIHIPRNACNAPLGSAASGKSWANLRRCQTVEHYPNRMPGLILILRWNLKLHITRRFKTLSRILSIFVEKHAFV